MSAKKNKILRLILGDQLNPGHSWFTDKSESVDYVIMEIRQETDYVRHHIQKICGFFLAMRQFASWLHSRGHKVIYLKLDDKSNRQELAGNIKHLIEKNGYDCFEYLLPDEFRLDRQLRVLSERLPCITRATDSQHFLTSRDEVEEFFRDRKQYRMEYFYRHMRRKFNILIEKDKPAGGRWNYDIENRSKYRGRVPLPEPLLFKNKVVDIMAMVEKCGVEYIGNIDPGKFIWPVNRRQALRLLNHFLRHALPHFGTYQDAMITEDWSLFHSRISFSLNTKILHPMTVINRVIETGRKRPKEIGLAQVEGYIRQILGWREYVRGIYWQFMSEFATMNFFDHSRKLPRFYWDGKTKMNCMAHAIGQSLNHAYAHHIQRLMITGNFALLAGIDPGEVDAWYLGIYIDAVEWVEVPNARGMSQFADGGITASKPYVSTSNYINAMSNYCQSCDYSFKKRYGEKACPFNSLYWHFFNRHRDKLINNPRLGNMYRTWDKKDNKEKKLILNQAGQYLKKLEDL